MVHLLRDLHCRRSGSERVLALDVGRLPGERTFGGQRETAVGRRDFVDSRSRRFIVLPDPPPAANQAMRTISLGVAHATGTGHLHVGRRLGSADTDQEPATYWLRRRRAAQRTQA